MVKDNRVRKIDVEEAVELRRQGWTCIQLAEKYHVQKTSVSRATRKYYKRESKVDVDLFVSLREHGWTCKQIAKKYHFSKGTISRNTSMYIDKSERCCFYSIEVASEIIGKACSIHGSGKTWNQVAEELGVNARKLKYMVSKYYKIRKVINKKRSTADNSHAVKGIRI